MSVQHGIFPRWKKGTPLHKVPFTDFCDMVATILETARGVSRPSGSTPYGWGFGEETQASSSSATVPEPWDWSLDGNTLTMTNCIWGRGPVTQNAGTLSLALNAEAGGTVYVSRRIDNASHAATLVAASTFDEAVFSDEDAVKYDYSLRLLLVLVYNTTTETWDCTLDARHTPLEGMNV